MSTTTVILLIGLGALFIGGVLIAGRLGWLKPFVTDHAGNFSSALFWRSVWHLMTAGFAVWAAVVSGPTLGLLGFSAGMAGVEGVQYIMRRGQDKRAAQGQPGRVP